MQVCSIVIHLLDGGILGVPAGVYLLLHLPSDAHREPTRSLRLGLLADACAGFLGGLSGGFAAFPRAFVSIWCGFKVWDKAGQRGVYQPFILDMQPITLVVIDLMRPSTWPAQLDWKTLARVPAALLSARLGLRIFRRLSDRQFSCAVNVLLVLSGIGLLI